MNFIKDNNISKYNYNTKYYAKLCIIKCNITNKYNINNSDCLKGKNIKYDDNIINNLINYCNNNNFIKEEQYYTLYKYENKYKYDIQDKELIYYKKEFLNGKLYDDNLLYCEISVPINFYEMPNIIYDEVLKHRFLYIKEYNEIKKDIIDNKLIENPKLIIENNDNIINISLDLCNYKNNYIINDKILYDLINILNILNININKDIILNYIDDIKNVCLN